MPTVTLRIGTSPLVFRNVEIRRVGEGNYEILKAPGRGGFQPLITCGQLRLMDDGETVRFLGCYYTLEASAFEVLQALTTTIDQPISGKELCRLTNNEYADRTYRRMREDVPWSLLLKMNDEGGRGYALVDVAIRVDGKSWFALSGPPLQD